MVAQVNAARLAAGKSSLGWINPSLYALSSSIILNDITAGINNCAAGAVVCCGQGFPAATGWDPVTGIGSVNFTAFRQTFMALGNLPNVPTLAPTPSTGSNHPVFTPTAAPSIKPTAAPSTSTGWIYTNNYLGTDCSGTLFQVEGKPTGVCEIRYGFNNQGAPVAVGSSVFSCGGGSLTF